MSLELNELRNKLKIKFGNKTTKYRYRETTKKPKINLPNRITMLTKPMIDDLKTINPIYRYNKDTKNDEILLEENNNYTFFHISLNTHSILSVQSLKDTFNFIKNKYGYFLYGKDWVNKLKLNYDLAIEQMGSTHLHIVIYNISLDKIKLFYNFLTAYFKENYRDTTSYCKVIDDTNGLIAYLSKYDIPDKPIKTNAETYFYDYKYFIRE